TREPPDGATHEAIDHALTKRRWCLVHASIPAGFCTGSNHHLLLMRIRCSHKLKKIYHRLRRIRKVYDEDIRSKFLSSYNWQINEDATEAYELLVEEL
ncbi:hypothetical protein Angca_001829, partial [Angiostrongylus cantonensis]